MGKTKQRKPTKIEDTQKIKLTSHGDAAQVVVDNHTNALNILHVNR